MEIQEESTLEAASKNSSFTTAAPPTTEAPAPAPSTPGPVRVGGDIQEPKKIKNVNPVYLEAAKRAGPRHGDPGGSLSAEGRVTDVRVLRGVRLLDLAAIEAVRQWRRC